MLSCKNSSSSTKDVKLNFVTNDSITPYTISIKKYSYINKYIRDILKEFNISKNQIQYPDISAEKYVKNI